MGTHRSLYLGIGMLGCCVLLVAAIAGLASSLRGQAGVLPSVQVAPESTPTPAPEPIMSVHVPILMYHHLKNVGEEVDPDYQQLVVAPQAFAEQMTYLQDHGYHTVTFAQLLTAFNGRSSLPAKPVIVTFDDGWDDIYHVAYPILRERGMVATFFISTNWIENLDGVVSWEQIEEMAAGGMEFGSHSVTHPYLTQVDADWLAYELEGSKAALEEHTGKPVTALAYPFGLYDDTVIAAAHAAGYRAACTIDPGSTARAGELMTLPRLWVYDWTDLEAFAALLVE